MLLESYNGLLSRARTLNDVNRINIAFGNTMTPQEAVELEETLFQTGYELPPLQEDRAFTEAQVEQASRRWIDDIIFYLRQVGKQEAEPFLRRDLRKSVTLYTDGQARAGKSLIVGFPGANHRLMMPTASFLQALPSERVDVVLIRDGTRSAYRNGLEGVGDSLEEFADGLPELLGFADYDRVVGLGVSSGGLPILLVSLRLNLDAVLVCGGNSPFDTRWSRPGDLSPVVMLQNASAKGFQTRVTVAHGGQSDDDRASAADIAACLGIEALEVTVENVDVKHNILLPILKEGRLPAFLEERLGL